MEVNKKVLVVDDEPHILLILEKVLKKHGCDILKAENGEKAIKLLKQHSDFDIVILDIMMPDVNGIEVCRHIRNDPALKTKPIIMLTADRDEQDKEECINLGISEYITKPFSPKSLAARIEEILDRY